DIFIVLAVDVDTTRNRAAHESRHTDAPSGLGPAAGTALGIPRWRAEPGCAGGAGTPPAHLRPLPAGPGRAAHGAAAPPCLAPPRPAALVHAALHRWTRARAATRANRAAPPYTAHTTRWRAHRPTGWWARRRRRPRAAARQRASWPGAAERVLCVLR